jgi:hypothetical protein
MNVMGAAVLPGLVPGAFLIKTNAVLSFHKKKAALFYDHINLSHSFNGKAYQHHKGR